MSSIYIVFEQSGEWEDYRETPIISFKKEDKAKEYLKNIEDNMKNVYSVDEYNKWVDEVQDNPKFDIEPYIDMTYPELILLIHPELDKYKLELTDDVYYQYGEISYCIKELELVE